MKRLASYLSITVLLLTGCGVARQDTDSVAQDSDTTVRAAAGTDPAKQRPAATGAGQAAQRPPSVPDLPPAPSKVVKNARIELEVPKGEFASRFRRASAVADRLGGFVSSSTTSSSKDDVGAGDIVLRVPSDRFQEAVDALSALGKVTTEERSGQDVTKQFVDLQARLRHAKAQEAFFLKLLDQSKTISDLVQVQQQLAGVQLQVEQIQGELQFLEDQTSFSTISAHLFEPGAAPGPQPKGLAKAWQEAWTGFRNGFAVMIVGAGYVLPFALISLAGFGIHRGVRRPRSQAAPTPTS